MAASDLLRLRRLKLGELRNVQFVGYQADLVLIPGNPDWNPHNPDAE